MRTMLETAVAGTGLAGRLQRPVAAAAVAAAVVVAVAAGRDAGRVEARFVVAAAGNAAAAAIVVVAAAEKVETAGREYRHRHPQPTKGQETMATGGAVGGEDAAAGVAAAVGQQNSDNPSGAGRQTDSDVRRTARIRLGGGRREGGDQGK